MNRGPRVGVATVLLLSAHSFRLDLAQASDSRITLQSVGGYRLGAAASFAPNSGCVAMSIPAVDGLSVVVEAGKITSIAVRSKNYATRSGIKVGSTVEELRKAYGDKLTPFGTGLAYVANSDADRAFRLSFQPSGSAVEVIRVSYADVDAKGCRSTVPSVPDPPPAAPDSTSKPAVQTPTSTPSPPTSNGALASVLPVATPAPTIVTNAESGTTGAYSAEELARRLANAYPDSVVASGNSITVRGAAVQIVSKLTVLDGDIEKRMGGATIGDQFSIPYPKGCPVNPPTVDEDPGRLRNEKLFRAMYGSSSAAVAKNLSSVSWFGSKVAVTTVNGVDRHLAAVAAELEAMPGVRKYLAPSGGAFNWRTIAGENVLSMHSFGIAIDLNTKYSDYWRWSGKGTKKYVNRIPCSIAQVFEKHGFIWGAKWYHFDSMHFEYRPELL